MLRSGGRRPVERPVRYRQVRDAATGQRPQRLRPDPARAQDERPLAVEGPEDALGERDRHRARGSRARPERRLGASPTSGRDRRAEQELEDRARGSPCRLVRVSNLAEDLCLAEDEGVEAGSDPREMSGDVLARVDVEMVDERRGVDVVCVGERGHERVARVVHVVCERRVELDAVTRRERDVLDDLGAPVGPETERAEALAQLHGSRAVAETEADQALHDASTLY